jgi:hypothetical protein
MITSINPKTVFNLGLIAIAASVITGCSKPQDRIMGTWIVDVPATKDQSQEFLAKEFPIPAMAEMDLSALGSGRLDFTSDEVTMALLDEKRSGAYTVSSFKDGVLKIETTRANGNNIEMVFKFLEDGTILLDSGSENFNLVWRKVN